MIDVSLKNVLIFAAWFTGAFLLIAAHKQISFVHNALHYISTFIVQLYSRISLSGLFTYTALNSLNFLRILFKTDFGLKATLRRTVYLCTGTILLISLVLSYILYQEINDEFSNFDAANLEILSQNEKTRLHNIVAPCFEPSATIENAQKLICHMADIELSFLLNVIKNTESDDELITIIEKDPAIHLVFWLDFKSNIAEQQIRTQGKYNYKNILYFIIISELVSEGVFYIISASLLLFISVYITIALIRIAIKISPKLIFPHILVPPTIVVIDFIIAGICFFGFISIVYVSYPYLYYFSRLFGQLTIEVAEYFFLNPYDLAGIVEQSWIKAIEDDPTLSHKLLDVIRLPEKSIPLVDFGQSLSIGDFFPRLSIVLESTFLHTLFYFDRPLFQAIFYLIDDLRDDILFLVALELRRIDIHETLRNYFIIIPLLPIVIHAGIYFLLILFTTFYYMIFVPIKELSAAAIARGPAYVYGSVIMALFGLLAWLFPPL